MLYSAYHGTVKLHLVILGFFCGAISYLVLGVHH